MTFAALLDPLIRIIIKGRKMIRAQADKKTVSASKALFHVRWFLPLSRTTFRKETKRMK